MCIMSNTQQQERHAPGKKWLDSSRPAVLKDDDDVMCPWEEEGVAPAVWDGAGGGDTQPAGVLEQAARTRRGRGRPPRAHTLARAGGAGGELHVSEHGRRRVGGATRRHALSEDNGSLRQAALLRLGARGIFNVEVDELGRLVAP